ncbi:MAG TPA: class I SAM-dependent methyltransferase [Puia sp.]|nr:class I SAM-dependent methyltransferase [Puia sp.]
MYLPDSSILTNIQVKGHPRLKEILFEKKYILLRSMEGRLYADDQLFRLPDINEDHPHWREWQVRKRSARRLTDLLTCRKKPLRILEVGCGNGWLSHQLAEIPGVRVTGLDINFTELQQAARVFSDDPNLRFIQGDIRTGILDDQLFDCIVFACSIEYFPSLKKIIHFTLTYLVPGGELHILDTLFYKPSEIEFEKRKTLAYYSAFGYPEMADSLFHHSWKDLGCFRYELLFDPGMLINRLLRPNDIYPWICIKNN